MQRRDWASFLCERKCISASSKIRICLSCKWKSTKKLFFFPLKISSINNFNSPDSENHGDYIFLFCLLTFFLIALSPHVSPYLGSMKMYFICLLLIFKKQMIFLQRKINDQCFVGSGSIVCLFFTFVSLKLFCC